MDWLPRALIAGAFAGGLAVAITVMIERWGGRVGGVLGTIPSTIIPASVGLYAGGDPVAFAEAMDSSCAGMLVSAGFLWTWRTLPPLLPPWPLRRQLLVMVILSLSGWVLLASGAVGLRQSFFQPGETQWFGWGATLILVGVGLGASWRYYPAPRGQRSVSFAMLVARGCCAGLAIFSAIGAAAIFGGFVAGLAAVFPAIFLTAMAGLWISQGRAVPAGAAGPMMLGSSAVAFFALAAKHTIPWYGPVWGSAAAWIFAVLFASVPAATWLSWRARVALSEPQ
ncbi:MAG: hypothetical protein VX405_10890 [Myxococcota bacterium]|nr:hypothetical protein [Myxococcota bacterium]